MARPRWKPNPGVALGAAVAVAGIAVIVVASLAALGGDGSPAPPSPPAGESPITVPAIRMVAPSGGCWLGAYVHFENPRDVASLESQVLALNASVGRPLDIDHHYIRWGALLAGDLAMFDVQHGMIPMLSWQAISSTRILSGDEDGWIRTQARAIHQLSVPVFIRYGWEVDIHSEWSGTPQDYIGAWRRLRTIFEEEGAVNATWVWSPTSAAFATGEAQRFYPGDDAVDWIAADGYNWPPGRPLAPWRSFEKVFRPFYGWAARSGKPLMVAETGVQERGPGEKAQWLRDMAATLRSTYPKIRALVYFDTYARYDWRLNTSTEAFEAFRQIAGDVSLAAPLGGNVRSPAWTSPSPTG